MCCSLGEYIERLRGGDKTIATFPCPTGRLVFTVKSNQDVADLTSIHFITNMLEILAIQEKAQSNTSCSKKKMNEEVDEVYGELLIELNKHHDEIKEYLD